MFLLMFVRPPWVSVMSNDVPPMSTVMMLSMPRGLAKYKPACGADAGPELTAYTAFCAIARPVAMPPFDWKYCTGVRKPRLRM